MKAEKVAALDKMIMEVREEARAFSRCLAMREAELINNTGEAWLDSANTKMHVRVEALYLI